MRRSGARARVCRRIGRRTSWRMGAWSARGGARGRGLEVWLLLLVLEGRRWGGVVKRGEMRGRGVFGLVLSAICISMCVLVVLCYFYVSFSEGQSLLIVSRPSHQHWVWKVRSMLVPSALRVHCPACTSPLYQSLQDPTKRSQKYDGYGLFPLCPPKPGIGCLQ